MIAEIFTASHRGVANGIFSWGVYYGYGLAFVFGEICENIIGIWI